MVLKEKTLKKVALGDRDVYGDSQPEQPLVGNWDEGEAAISMF